MKVYFKISLIKKGFFKNMYAGTLIKKELSFNLNNGDTII